MDFGELVAQEAHFAWGYLIYTSLIMIFRVSHPVAVVAELAISGGKEALEALGWAPWEAKQTWGDSGLDFALFQLGLIYGIWVMHHYGK